MARRVLRLLVPCLGLVSCTDKLQPSEDSGQVKPDDSGGADSEAGETGETGDSGETGDTGDTGTPVVLSWTEGPALPDCAPQAGAGDLVALSGVVLTPEGAEAGLVVYSRDSGLITCVGADCDTSSAEVVCTEGVITPGLIDAHDHLQYNALKPWRHEELYCERYEWRSDDDYWDYREAYDEIEGGSICEIGKWAELRALVGGATSAVGSYDEGGCINVGIRNLDEDEDASGIEDYKLVYSASTITDKDEGDAANYNAKLASGEYDAVENHVAEGACEEARGEIDHSFSIGLEGEGHIYVHASDASTSQLARMAEKGTAIAWSPRSNLDLYADTTPADIARRLGVSVILGPDWTWSGSHNMPGELSCATEFLAARGAFGENGITDVDVWGMATGEAARVLGLGGVLGSIEVGAAADLSVFPWSDEPYRAIIQAEPEDTRLVVMGGRALYGLPDLVTLLNDRADWCESVDVCDDSSEGRLICLRAAESGDDAQTVAEVEGILSSGLGAVEMSEELAYAAELLGLWACDEPATTCDPGQASDGDADGDGVADTSDLCAGAWDPRQADQDDDGVGDVCDPCPLVPDATSCRMDPEDIDDDGVRTDLDLCPYLYDPDQLDSDGDGAGDACDRCPDDVNPDDGACPASVAVLSDESHPDHPAQHTTWSLSGLIVTAVRADNGYYAQDPTLSAYAGVFVYDYGDAPVDVGDEVSVSGKYQEYYDLVELYDVTTEITGTGSVEPMVIDDTCSVGTGGADAETYEAMLITVSRVTVTDENPDAPDDYNEFEVDDCLRVDDLLWLEPSWLDRTVGTTYTTMTGVLNYSFENFKISPRDEDDVVLGGG